MRACSTRLRARLTTTRIGLVRLFMRRHPTRRRSQSVVETSVADARIAAVMRRCRRGVMMTRAVQIKAFCADVVVGRKIGLPIPATRDQHQAGGAATPGPAWK
jgi:hypothetical protein